MFRFIVRFVIRPFVEALKSELNWWSNAVSLESELKAQLESVSKEQLKVLLDDKLSHEVFDLRADITKLKAHITVMEKNDRETKVYIAELRSEIETVQGEVKVLGKVIRAVQQDETRKFFEKTKTPREVKTDVLEFGD